MIFAEPWDYVTFRPGRMTGRDDLHPQVSYQVASKQELEVIYEPLQQTSSRTVWIVLASLLLFLCLAAGTGLALWQSGLLGEPGSEDQLNTTSSTASATSSSSSSPGSSTASASSSSSATTSLGGGSVVDLKERQSFTTTTSPSTDLILDSREGNRLMLLLGEPGTILGHWR